MIREEWRPVVGYEGRYEVSNRGHVRRIAPDSMGRTMSLGRVLTQAKTAGYMRVGLCVEGRQRSYLVHRLVAAAFIGPCPLGQETNHLDGIKDNNKLENLEYVTKSENIRHARSLGLLSIGSMRHNTKLTERDVVVMRSLRAFGVCYPELCRMYSMALAPIMAICKGTQWRHAEGPIDPGGQYPLSKLRDGKLMAIRTAKLV
jgi:HNH endonuclease/NUMOD4 motif